MRMNNILRAGAGDGTPGGGGTPPGGSWRESIATLPEEIRSHASLRDIQDIPALVTSYVNAQKMVGAEKMLKPQQNWGEKEWTNFYQQLGRPENPDSYSFKVEPEKIPEGITIDENRMKEAKATLHKLGLTDKQAAGALQYYLDSMIRSHTDAGAAQEQAKMSAMAQLREKFGINYDSKIEMAKAVIRKFGGEELRETIDSVGNNPGFIQLFAAIGEAMMEGTARGAGDGLIVTDASQALSEINVLKTDAEFMKALMERQHPGHKAAVEKWTILHEKAHPSK